jgi:hypothetical protein
VLVTGLAVFERSREEETIEVRAKDGSPIGYSETPKTKAMRDALRPYWQNRVLTIQTYLARDLWEEAVL